MNTPQNRFAIAVRQRRLSALGPDPATDELASGLVPSEEPELSTNRFAVAARVRGVSLAEVGGFTRRETDIGITEALGAGIKQGFLDPLTIFGLEIETPDLDTTGEKVANVLGSFIGLGIGFIPFAFGSGAILKGIGLTKRIPRLLTSIEGVTTRNPLYGFIQNTLAGTVQIAGTSEEISDLPLNIAIGASFGAAVEGLFLARAMKGRRGASSTAKEVADGSPHGDIPVDLDLTIKEIVIAPNNASHGAPRIRTEIKSLFEEDRTYDEALTLLAQEHAETVRIPGLKETQPTVDFARSLYPNAQILSRSVRGREAFEVLVHNPTDPADLLTPKQIQQWKKFGFAEGQEILYGSPAKSYKATGKIVEPGFVQLIDPLRPRNPFAVRIEEATRPLLARFFTESNVRRATLQRAIIANEGEIGMVIPSAARGESAALTAKRGIVDVAEYEEISSFPAWLEKHKVALADIDAADIEEAAQILGRTLGIKGLVIKESGLTVSVKVFDQRTVNFITQPPIIGAPRGELPAGVTEATRPRLRIRPVDGAAVRLPDGTIRTGSSHFEIAQELRAEGLESAFNKATDGFIDTSGNFISKEKGFRLEEIFEQLGDVPNVGLTLDNSVTSLGPNGETILHSFEPSWRNSMGSALRRQGVTERDLPAHLDMFVAQMEKRLDGLMDAEFIAMKNASEIKFGDCL